MRSNADNLEVLFEDNHLIVINKKVGDIVQGDKTGDQPLSEITKSYIKAKYQKPGNVFLGVVHRLDRPTSGALIFAKTSKALSRLNKMLAEKEIRKTYWAVVEKKPKEPNGTLTHWLLRKADKNKSFAHDKEVTNSKKAVLHYRLMLSLEHYHLLKITLETGRHHQIRSQLAKIDCPIKGDLKYGAKRSNKNGGIHLHARELAFVHPVKKEPINIVAPTPSDAIWDACLKNT